MESTSARMVWLGDRIMVDNKIPDIKYLLAGIDKVTEKDIIAVCGKIFRAALINLAVVGRVSEKDKKIIQKEAASL